MSEIAAILERFWQLRRLMLLAVALGVIAGLTTTFKLSTEPPFLESRSSTRGVAATEVLVDSERSALTNIAYDLRALAARTQVFVQLVSTSEVRERIARELGIEPGRLAVVPLVQRVPGVPSRDPAAGERSEEIAQELLGYRLEVRAAGELPILELTAQAPDAEGAARLANAAARATIAYLEELGELRGDAAEAAESAGAEATEGPGSRLTVADAQALAFGEVGFRQLGPARPSTIVAGGGIAGGVLVGVLTFVIVGIALFFLAGVLRELRLRRRDRSQSAADPAAAVD